MEYYEEIILGGTVLIFVFFIGFLLWVPVKKTEFYNDNKIMCVDNKLVGFDQTHEKTCYKIEPVK